MALLPDELARAVAALRDIHQVAMQGGHRTAHQKELVQLLDWLSDGAACGRAHAEAPLPQGVRTADDEISLATARTIVRAKIAEGSKCLCCNQWAKLYKRKLNSAMAQSLVLIYQFFAKIEREDPKLAAETWLHVPEFLMRAVANASAAGGDATKLRYWGLLLPRPDLPRSDGSNRQGFYRITPLGKEFVEGKRRLAKHVFLYNQECLGFSEEQITVHEALAERFDYGELMATTTIGPTA